MFICICVITISSNNSSSSSSRVDLEERTARELRDAVFEDVGFEHNV